MARWRQSFIYNGPNEAAEVFGHRFPRGETVVIAFDKWNRGMERMAARAGVTYLGLVDVLAPPAEPAPVAEPPRISRRRRDSQWR